MSAPAQQQLPWTCHRLATAAGALDVVAHTLLFASERCLSFQLIDLLTELGSGSCHLLGIASCSIH